MDEVLIICAWPNQNKYAKFNLYDYSLVAAITLCCYAHKVHCCNLVLIGRHICFVVNCQSSYAKTTMLVCVACAKVITPYSNNFLSFPFPKVLVYRYLYECYLSFVLLCISNQKQPSCKKRSAALEKAMVKKDVKSEVAAKKWL